MTNHKNEKPKPGRRTVIAAAVGLAAACTLLLIVPEASAQLMPSDAPLQYSASLLASGNPRLGAIDLRLQYRHPLGGAGSGAAIGGFAAIAAGPAGVRPGVGLQIQPMAIL